MTYVTELASRDSGHNFPETAPRNNAGPPGDILEVRYDLDRIAREVDRDRISAGPASMWRYKDLLPVADPAGAVTLAEGWTPLLPVPRLAAHLGCKALFAKDEGRNPSGTFKDRGAAVAVSRLRELGVRKVVHASSGNAAGSWALYAARGGIECVNLLPDDVTAASLAQSSLAGAETYILDAPWGTSGALVGEAARKHGWFLVQTLKEPYRLEGKKTLGLEIAEQLGWQLPAAIVYPTGGALGAIAIYKGIEELIRLGWVEGGRLPKLIVCQYEGCAPIVQAFLRGEARATPWQKLDVPPGGLKSTNPPGDKAVLELVRRTRGAAIAITSEEAFARVSELARLEGLFAAPESAITIAATQKALDAGILGRDERIVVVLTGSGLKSVTAIQVPPVRRLAAGAVLGD